MNTLLRHSALYLMARGVSGGLNFLALAIYSRILSPTEYGYYAMAVVIVGLGDAALFQGLRFGLFRFMPVYETRREAFLATIAVGFLGLVGLSAGLALIALAGLHDPALHRLVAMALILLWVQAWFQLNLEMVRSQLSPQQYGYMVCIKSVFAILTGGAFTWYGQWGALGPIMGLTVGTFVPVVWQTWSLWRGIRLTSGDWVIGRQVLGYGLPLAANAALGFVIHTSDRVLLGWWQGADAVGLYATGYDLSQQALVTLMMTVNLAAYPLVVRALEHQGTEAARMQMVQYVTFLLAAVLPGLVMLVVLAPNVADVVLGTAFRAPALSIIPWIALATLLAGIKTYYTDLAFQLGQSTLGQAWVMAIAAVVNLGLNLWWIPTWGLYGATYATVMAYGIALGLSWGWGCRIWPLPLPGNVILQLALAGLGLAVGLWPLRNWTGGLALGTQLVMGLVIYAGLFWALNVAHCRDAVRGILRRPAAPLNADQVKAQSK